ncbi:LysE family translocator [Sulfitobacter pacificus]|uniref:Lysine transporter LysE n=1 Tax=Sulfitobacter pacificus TaxID=1499314 RepID=A0ABQ5VKK4_9RHOB|nr:LysE family translocator [Sulfitobacter pacificus]GLQ27579.1 lysine transporter LysE [Sulfitobacter pacificus]
MIEELLPYFTYVGALAIAAVIPGPGVAAVVGRALSAGSGSSLLFILGLASGDVLFLSIAVLGLSALAAAASSMFFLVKVLGGLYLLYLASKFWTAEVEQTQLVRVPEQNPWIVVVSGFAVTLGNPKTVVFYLALLPNVLDLTKVGLVDWFVLSTLTMTTLMLVLVPYAVLAGRLRTVLTRPKALRTLNRGAAVMIGGAGALILRDAAK